MVHVRPLAGKTDRLDSNSAGAFAIILALAHDETDYRETVAAEMESLGLFVAEIEHLAPYVPHEDDTEGVRKCASRLSAEWPIQYQDSHNYPSDDA
jgi:hypothetical protein